MNKKILLSSIMLLFLAGFVSAALVAPKIEFPSGTTSSFDLNLNWSDVSGAKNYQYEVRDIYKVYASGTVSASQADVARSLVSLNRSYSWRVKACDTSCSTWANGNFTLDPTPTLQFPIVNSIVDSFDFSLSWAQVGGAKYYEYEIQDSGYKVIQKGTSSSTSQKVDPNNIVFDGTKTYYWKARACVDSSLCSKWSSLGSFNPRVAPKPVSPINSVTVASYNISLNWSSISGAQIYEYELKDGVKFVETGKITGTSKNIDYTKLVFNGSKTYSWRVRACLDSNSTKCGAWSVYNSFKPNTTPISLAPGYGTRINSFDVVISWAEVIGSQYYEYSIAKTGGSEVEAGKTTEKSKNIDPSKLDFSGQQPYLWRVRSCLNSALCSNWTSYMSFTPEAVLKQQSPLSNAIITQFFVNFDWSDISGAKIYRYEITDNTSNYGGYSFIPTKINKYSGTSTESFVKVSKEFPIWDGKTYYWRVRACYNPSDEKTCGPFTNYLGFKTNLVISINSPPSPPNRIDILSPPVVFDWKDNDMPGYEYEVINNGNTASVRRGKTTSTHVELDYGDTINDFFSNRGSSGYNWRIRGCVDDKLTNCNTPWTSASMFSVQQSLSSSTVRISTRSRNRVAGATDFYAARGTTDIVINAALVGVMQFQPLLFSSSSSNLTVPTNSTLKKGEILRVNVGLFEYNNNASGTGIVRPPPPPPSSGGGGGGRGDSGGGIIPTVPVLTPGGIWSFIPQSQAVNNGSSWSAIGGVNSDPPIFVVDDARAGFARMARIPDNFTFTTPVNLGGLGTYNPRIGMAASNPYRNSRMQVTTFDAHNMRPGTIVTPFKQGDEYFLKANKPGRALVVVNIPSIDTYQTIDNRWFQSGTIVPSQTSFILTVGNNGIPDVDAGPNEETVSNGTVSLDKATAFDPDKDDLEYSWTCDIGTISNPKSLHTTYVAPKVDKETVAHCTLTVTDENGGTSSDTLTITIFPTKEDLPNVPPMVIDPKIINTGANSYCNGGVLAELSWGFDDVDDTQSAFDIILIPTDGSESITIHRTGNQKNYTLEANKDKIPYNGKDYNWQIIVYDSKNLPSEPVMGQGKIKAPAGPPPLIDFTYTKTNNSNVAFDEYLLTDISNCFGAEIVNRQWTIDVGTIKPDPANPLSNGSMIASIPAGQQANITLRIKTDAGPEFCSVTKKINAQKKSPTYQEVVPW